MASLVEEIADALALDVIRAAQEIGDDSLIDDIAKVIGASSTTTQEAFLTAVRVRLSEQRARRLLAERLGRPERPDAAQPRADGPAPMDRPQDVAAEGPTEAPPPVTDSAKPDGAESRVGEAPAVVRPRLPPSPRGPVVMNSPAVSPSSPGLARALAESLSRRSDPSGDGPGGFDGDRD